MYGKLITALSLFAIIFFSAWYIEANELSKRLKAEQLNQNQYESEWSNLEIEADVTEFAPREYVKIRSVS